MSAARKPNVVPLICSDGTCFDARALAYALPYKPKGSQMTVFNLGHPDPSKRILFQLSNQVVMFPVNRPGEKRGKFESTKYSLDLPVLGYLNNDETAHKLVGFFETVYNGCADFVERNHEAFLPITDANPTDEDRLVNSKMAKKKVLKLVKYNKDNKYDPRITFKLRWNPDTKEVLTPIFLQPTDGPLTRATVDVIERGCVVDILFGMRGIITGTGIQLTLVAEQIRVHPAQKQQLDTSVPQFLDAGAAPSAAAVAAAAAAVAAAAPTAAATAATGAPTDDAAAGSDQEFEDEDM